jgi:hypothetical protein
MHIPKPATRTDKKQIAAHLDPDMVARMKAHCKATQITLQELIAMAVNAAVGSRTRGEVGPLLRVHRERLVRRVNAQSKVQTTGPECRTGTRRVAAYFQTAEIERLRAFCKEKGLRQEHLIEEGIRALLFREDAVA